MISRIVKIYLLWYKGIVVLFKYMLKMLALLVRQIETKRTREQTLTNINNNFFWLFRLNKWAKQTFKYVTSYNWRLYRLRPEIETQKASAQK